MNYQRIYEFDLANGTGVRVSLFVSGCSIRCPGCFNKEAWDFCSGKPFGRKQMKAIKKILKKDEYAGLSILGGEPFDQDKKGTRQMIKLCKFAHRHNKNVWIWSGHKIDELKERKHKLLRYCDILIDGPFIEEYKTDKCAFRGSSNQEFYICNLF